MLPLPLAFLLAVATPMGTPDGASIGSPAPAPRWGEHGHLLVGRAAADALPEAMPPFFREAAAQLSYLNAEPDRWRARDERDRDPAMDAAYAPEHYVDLELVPPGARAARDRYAYADSLRAHGADAAAAGLAPYRMLELAQRLRTEFRRWRAATDSTERAWIEQRVIDDAGVLGHYVADAANPHHTTVHHDRWVGANPRGFTTERGFHGRFESAYVGSHVTLEEVRGAMGTEARDVGDLRAAVWTHVEEAHGLVERLYELDLQEPFGPATAGAEHEAFAVERLAAGATMLRDLWWTAWVSSGATD